MVVFTNWPTYKDGNEWEMNEENEVVFCKHYPMEFGFNLCLTNWVCIALGITVLVCPMLQVLFVLKMIASTLCCVVGWRGEDDQQVSAEAAPTKDVQDIA